MIDTVPHLVTAGCLTEVNVTMPVIHFVLIIGSVRRERCDWIADLVEQCASSRGVIDVFFGQFDRDNFAASGIDTYMQPTPEPPTRRAVFFNQPFTSAAEFKAGAVHQEMEWFGSGPAKWRQFQRPASAAHRRMIRYGEYEPE
jgi:hypothetical protein